MALKLGASTVYVTQSLTSCQRTQNFPAKRVGSEHLRYFSPKIYCSMSMSSDQSEGDKKISIGHMNKARTMWENCPEPVKTFPWNKALDNFIQLVLDLFLSVMKYLSGPVFAITSISELSYCAHERKLYFVPILFLAGVAFAGVLKDASLDSSPYLKYAEAPWHLITSLVFFTFLKFLGPYYPYWGRVLVPHFANGALLRTLWFMFLWFMFADFIHDYKFTPEFIHDKSGGHGRLAR